MRIIYLLFKSLKRRHTSVQLTARDGRVILNTRGTLPLSPNTARRLASELSAFAEIAERSQVEAA